MLGDPGKCDNARHKVTCQKSIYANNHGSRRNLQERFLTTCQSTCSLFQGDQQAAHVRWITSDNPIYTTGIEKKNMFNNF